MNILRVLSVLEGPSLKKETRISEKFVIFTTTRLNPRGLTINMDPRESLKVPYIKLNIHKHTSIKQ
jgi:hypothetical protein